MDRNSVTGTTRVEPAARLHVLREYALLADGERGALVGPSGEIAWMCFPGFDSDGIFSTLIGAAGLYAVTPAEPFVWGGWYEPGSLIWRGRFVIAGGAIVECRDALMLPAERRRAVLLRRLVGIAGRVVVDVVLDPRACFGDERLQDVVRDDDGWRARSGPVHVGWWGAADARAAARATEPAWTTRMEVREGETHDLVLVLDSTEVAPPARADVCWSSTEQAWRERVPPLGLSVAGRDARHALAVLSGLTSASGGMVAAATMSLPERANEGRSFDYRYVWIRDQAYAGRAAARAGEMGLLDAAVRFTRDRLLDDRDQLMPAYTTAGDRLPKERRLDLPGYPGGTDVVGNKVRDQFQLDVFGEALLLFAEAAAHGRLEGDGRRAAEIAAGAIEARWLDEDAGIWELEPDEWTASRLLCAAGLRAISALGPSSERTTRQLALADAIVARTAERATHPIDGRWQRSARDDRIDASLLLGALRGAVPPDDPRALATLEAVLAELTEDGYVYRFRPDARPLGEAEGAFLFCGFLLALALAQQGRLVEAVHWFERNRAGCGPPGLFAEEYDVRQRQLRGNLPQAFVHAELLECAVALDAE